MCTCRVRPADSAEFELSTARVGHPGRIGLLRRFDRIGLIGLVGLIVPLAGCGGDDRPCERYFGSVCGLLRSSHSLALVADDAVAVDLDGDGQLEHVLLDRYSGGIGVLSSGGHLHSQSIGAVRGIAGGDFDGDGRSEIALAVDDPPRIKLLRWQGEVFEVGEQILLSADVLDLAAADLDNDGLDEVIIAHPEAVAVVRIVEQKVQEYPVGRTLVALDLADLDGDDALDLALVDFEGEALELLRGDGAGGFSSMASVPLGQAPEDLDLADINSDGAIDVVVRSRIVPAVWTVYGDGSGGFAAPILLEIGDQLDVGRGLLAIPAGESGLFGIATPGQLMRVAVSDGGPQPIAQANVVSNIQGQVLRDGFVAANGVFYEFEVQEGPNLAVIQELPSATAIAAGDLDGDGFAELLTVNRDDPELCTMNLRRGGPGGLDEQAQPLELSFGPALESGLGECPGYLKIIDINDDGLADLLATGGSQDEFWLQIAYGVGDQIFEPGLPLLFENLGKQDPTAIHLASGWMFVFLQNGDLGALTVNLDLQGELHPGSRLASDRHLWAAAAGDINGDLEEDLLLLSGGEERAVEVFLGGESGLTTGPVISQEELGLPIDGALLVDLTLVDLDEDGRAEVVLASAKPRYLNNSIHSIVNTPFNAKILVVSDLATSPQVVEVWQQGSFYGSELFALDVDGDGILDLARWSSYGLSVLKRGIDGYSETKELQAGRVQISDFADFDGDGSREIVGAGGGFGTSGETRIIDSLDVALPAATRYRALPSRRIGGEIREVLVAHGDFDGDHQQDVAMTVDGFGPRLLTTAWGDGGKFESATHSELLSAFVGSLAAADIDGDGRDELVVAEFGANQGYSLRIFAWQDHEWRLSGEALGTSRGPSHGLVIDDLDGDGVADMALSATVGDEAIDICIKYGRVDGGGSIVFDSSETVALSFEIAPEPALPGQALEQVLQSADLDGDGRPELLFSGGEGRTVLFWNDGGRRFQGQELPEAAAWITAIGKLVEIRGHELFQVPYYNRHRGEGARIFDNSSIGSWIYGVGDCNGDGREDLVTGGEDFFRLWLTIDRSFVRFEGFSSGYYVGQGVRCADINDDRIPDLTSVYDNGISTWVSEAE